MDESWSDQKDDGTIRSTLNSNKSAQSDKSDSTRKSALNSRRSDAEANTQDVKKPQKPAEGRIYLCRHGEQVDRIFPNWLELGFCEEEDGGGGGGGGKEKGRVWTPYNLNLPLTLGRRRGGYSMYRSDPPLTEMGIVASSLVGRGMKVLARSVTAIYSSPAYRCLQTALEIRHAVGSAAAIAIEPGLAHFPLASSAHSPPRLVSLRELEHLHYPFLPDYAPLVALEDVLKSGGGSSLAVAERIGETVKSLVESHKDAGSLLIVGHAGTVDAGGRALLELPALPPDEDVGMHYPFSSLLSFRLPSATNPGLPLELGPDLPPLSHFDIDTRHRNPFFSPSNPTLPSPQP